jgi:hypothetical protein
MVPAAVGRRPRADAKRAPRAARGRANLVEWIAEAEERVWLGEVKGLQDTLAALRVKATRLAQLTAAGITDNPAAMS